MNAPLDVASTHALYMDAFNDPDLADQQAAAIMQRDIIERTTQGSPVTTPDA